MKSRFYLLLQITCFFFFVISCKPEKEMDGSLNLLPVPDQISEIAGVSPINQLSFNIDNVEGLDVLKPWFDSEKIPVNNNLTENTTLVLNTNLSPDSYVLRIGKREIVLEYSTIGGIRNAIVSAAQLYEMNDQKLPITTIQDQTDFAYRGMHLDVGRHFFGVDDVKKYLDFMTFYKMNRFHWHLTDDQGWRIEIKRYPKLQEVASCRSETLIGHLRDKPQRFDGKEYCGYYTQEEIKEVVAYAAARGIEVIPEIDLPGHSTALLAAYPELGCVNKKYETATSWGVKEDVLCPKEETFTFLEGVFDEVMELFPSQYIHIGGDECPKVQWEQNALCQKIIKEENLGDEFGLQSYFIQRLERYLHSKGRSIIGWDEILEGGLAPNATVMSWRGEKGGLEAATMDHDVVMTPNTYAYFDYYQSENPGEPLAIGGYLPVQKVYSWEIIPPDLAADKGKHILGGQGNVWTEYIPDLQKLEYMAFTRLITLSEVLWGKNSGSFEAFSTLLSKHIKYWKENGVNIANHLSDISIDFSRGEDKSIEVKMSRLLPEVVMKTKNPKQSEFTESTTGTVVLEEPGIYEFSGELDETTSASLKVNFEPHLATYANVSFITTPDPKRAGYGTLSVVNGVAGDDKATVGKEWLGFNGNDASFDILFEDPTHVTSLKTRFYDGKQSWIWPPSEIDLIYYDANGKELLNHHTTDVPPSDGNGHINFQMVQSVDEVKLIRLTAKNYGKIPDGYPGSKSKPWVFVDEIRVE